MSPKRKRRVGRVLWALLALVPVVFAAAYVGSWWWLRSEERAWAASFGSWEELVRAFPSQPTNASALRLDQLTRALGFPMTEGIAKVADAPFKAAFTYVKEQSKASHDQVEPPPQEVARFLEEFRLALDAVEAHLLDGGAIAWEQKIEPDISAPMPRLWAHRHLQSVLLSRALRASAEGDAGIARRSLEASWQVNESLCSRSEITSSRFCILFASWQNAVLRSIREPVPGWEQRLGRDFRAQELRSLRLEVYAYVGPARGFFTSMADFNARRSPGQDRGKASAGAHVLTTPYLKLSVASYSRYIRTAAERTRSADACALEFSRLSQDALPRWNILRDSLPGVFEGARRALEASLDTEQTRVILAVRRSLKENGGLTDFPSVPSAVCPGVRWQVQRDAGGQVSVAPDHPPLADREARQNWTYTLTP